MFGEGDLAWRTVTNNSIHRLPDRIGMSVVPRVLLGHVDADVGQTGCP